MDAPGAMVGGVIASLCAAGGCAAAVWGIRTLGLAPGFHWPLTFLGCAAATGLVLSFIAGARRSALRRLASVLRDDAQAGNPLHAPSWAEPLALEASNAVRRWRDRALTAEAKAREESVRLTISEEERRHAEAILHSLRDAVLVTDSFNELALANQPAASLLGFDSSSSAHQSIDEIVRDETLRQAIKEVRKSGVLSKQKRLEHSLERPAPGGGNARSVYDVTLACLPDAQQQVGGVVTIMRDVTREKEISQMKSDFVSQASHELRTPISSINAYVEMLLDSEAPDEASRQEFYNIIKSEAERLSRMIDNMLNISRIEAGIVSAERSEVDFAKLIREVAETMQPQAKAKKITLIDKIGPLIYTAEADRDMMHQVIMNLVSNAVKYTPEEGRVTVTVENDDVSRAILVSVSDTGLGIPPEALPRLFEKFYRIENYKRLAKGTGLGLNLVKHIVETVHHGQVGVSSRVGMGSKFWFTVPYEFQGG